MIFLEEILVFFKRVEWTMNANHLFVRRAVIHNKNPSILFQRTDVMIYPTSDEENHDLSFIGWVDSVESLLGKDRSINVDARFEFESFLWSPRRRQCPFESLKPLRVERKLIFNPSLPILIGFPARNRCIIVLDDT